MKDYWRTYSGGPCTSSLKSQNTIQFERKIEKVFLKHEGFTKYVVILSQKDMKISINAF